MYVVNIFFFFFFLICVLFNTFLRNCASRHTSRWKKHSIGSNKHLHWVSPSHTLEPDVRRKEEKKKKIHKLFALIKNLSTKRRGVLWSALLLSQTINVPGSKFAPLPNKSFIIITDSNMSCCLVGNAHSVTLELHCDTGDPPPPKKEEACNSLLCCIFSLFLTHHLSAVIFKPDVAAKMCSSIHHSTFTSPTLPLLCSKERIS